MKLKKAQIKSIFLNSFLFISLISFISLGTYFYVAQEKYIYVWDYVHYYNLTLDLASTYQNSQEKAFQVFFNSFADDYNKLFCLPLIPIVLLFGNDRFVYILGCVLVYTLPFIIVVGIIATKIIPIYPKRVFWSTVLITVVFPWTWIPTFRGFPDIGAAVLLGLAIIVYLKNIRLNYWWQMPTIGFLLAISILFRRHFAYSVRAYFISIILLGTILYISDYKKNTRKLISNLVKYYLKIILVFIIAVTTFALLAPTYFQQILTTNFRSLYQSFEQPIDLILQVYTERYGGSLWLLTILGYSSGIITNTLIRPAASFLIIFGSFSFIQWVLTARQLGIHYTTHFTIFIILGIVAFFWTSWLVLRNKSRIIMLSLGGIILVINTITGLTPLKLFQSPLFSANYPPLVRQDYAEINSLIEYLRKNISRNEPIYVAGASFTLSNSVIADGENQIYGRGNQLLTLLQTADVDSRDFYPLENLLEAQYIIVASPYQFTNRYRYSPQNVIKTVVDSFNNNSEFAQDFKLLPQQFSLENGVLVKIYQRIRPTPLITSLRTLQIMQDKIQPKPGNQLDWIILKNKNQITLEKNLNKTINLSGDSAAQLSLLYFGKITETVELTGKLIPTSSTDCKSLLVQLKALDDSAKIVNQMQKNINFNNPSNLSFTLSSNQIKYLQIELQEAAKNSPPKSCPIQINELTVK